MRAPAELGRLRAFRDEPLDRPRVDEHAHALLGGGALGVALGDVDALDADLAHEPRPVLAAARVLMVDRQVAGEVEQRLLHEPRHHAGIGAAAGDRGRAAGLAPARGKRLLAQHVVGARTRALALVEIEPGPGLVHGVDVEGAQFAGELHDVDGRGVDREVDAKALPAAFRQQRRENLAVIVARERRLDEADAALVEKTPVLVGGIDHHEAALVILEMPLDQGQRPLADRAEADHRDGAGDAAVHRPIGHLSSPVGADRDGARPRPERGR